MRLLNVPHERVPVLLSVGAIVVLVATLAFALIPSPKYRATEKARQARFEIELQTQEAEENRMQAMAAVEKRVYGVQAEKVAPLAMSSASILARKHGLKIVAFRPQRVVTDAALPHVPYLITLDGPFPKVAAFMRDLDAKGSRLAVNLVQVASSDPASDRVNATIGAVAFLSPDVPKETPRG